MDFTLSNTRRFYLSKGDPLGSKRLRNSLKLDKHCPAHSSCQLAGVKTMHVLSSQDDYRDKVIHVADEGLCKSSLQLYMHSVPVSQMSLFWITIKPQIFFHYWILTQHLIFHFHLLFVTYILRNFWVISITELHNVVIGWVKRWSVKEVFR